MLTFGCVMIFLQVNLLRFLAYTRMWLRLLENGKPGSLHGSSSLSETLRDCVDLIDAALVNLQGFWVICFNVNIKGNTLALIQSPPATAVNVKPYLKLMFSF